VRLASFNILHGRAPDGAPAPLERLVAACDALDADLLCLQEVDRWQARSGGVDQTAEVAAATGAAAWRFQPALVGEPGGDWRVATDSDDSEAGARDRSAAGYGVGLVSRWPVREWHVLRLDAAPVRSPVFVPGARGGSRSGLLLLADEPRVVLAAEVEWPLGPVLVATTHLSFVPGWNVSQLRKATRFLDDHAGPRLLLGDLNLPGPVPAWASGWRSLARLPTFPADRPALQIDHVLASGPLPEPVAVAGPRLDLSDHRALVVDLGSR
jgi:endonuclease/exonuclease/phosphatase family metal-dependent hydrolase